MIVLTNLEQAAKDFAIAAHAGQRYGDQPYHVHLAAVRQVLADFGVGGDIAVAAWLHDVVEDTPVTVERLSELFGDDVAELVWTVTGVGHNRKARIDDVYAKLLGYGPDATILKLADRIANVEASKSDPIKLKMYQREQYDLESVIGLNWSLPPIGDMLERLRRALNVGVSQ